MTLDMAQKGQMLLIKKVKRDDVRPQAMRLGLYEGALLECSESIRNGPVILRSDFCEIAVGKRIAEQITVTKV